MYVRNTNEDEFANGNSITNGSTGTETLTGVLLDTNITGTITGTPTSNGSTFNADIFTDGNNGNIDRYCNKFILFTSGAMIGEKYRIVKHSGTTISVTPNFTSIATSDTFILIDAMPVNILIRNIGKAQIIDNSFSQTDTSEYEITGTKLMNELVFTLSSVSPSWTEHEHIGKYVYFTVGVNERECVEIMDNTENTLIFKQNLTYEIDDSMRAVILDSDTNKYHIGKYNVLFT